MEILQKILDLLLTQEKRLQELSHDNSELAQKLEHLTLRSLPLPYGLQISQQTKDIHGHLFSVHCDIQNAFYLSPSHLMHHSAYIHYWQLRSLDLAGKHLCVLTTNRVEYTDLVEATGLGESLEIRLHAINGPFTVITRDKSGNYTESLHPGNLESVFTVINECDIVWIPDPWLSSLVLRCRGQIQQVCERTKSLLLSIRTEDWNENTVRLLIHNVGFTEISRLAASEEENYVTRRDENLGFYVYASPAAVSTLPPILMLFSQKIPSPSFHCVNSTERAP
ncbi:MAG: hypothetical protein LBL48_01320 [Azoarcus sp.]|jgi:hypothetical protein|nr:hypothetical protein [Azoarcus sp.]